MDKMSCPRSSINYNHWTISVGVGMLYSNFGLIITENRAAITENRAVNKAQHLFTNLAGIIINHGVR